MLVDNLKKVQDNKQENNTQSTESIEKIEYTFNSENKQTEQVGQKEYTKDLELQSGKIF